MTRHRVMTFAEFTATPRTDEEIAAYHDLWGQLRDFGMIDERGREIIHRRRDRRAPVREVRT